MEFKWLYFQFQSFRRLIYGVCHLMQKHIFAWFTDEYLGNVDFSIGYLTIRLWAQYFYCVIVHEGEALMNYPAWKSRAKNLIVLVQICIPVMLHCIAIWSIRLLLPPTFSPLTIHHRLCNEVNARGAMIGRCPWSIASCSTFLLPYFNVICEPFLNRRTRTWNLFVKIDSE